MLTAFTKTNKSFIIVRKLKKKKQIKKGYIEHGGNLKEH